MSEGNQKSRILIVDDNPANAELLQAYLAAPELDISIASSGGEALAAVDRREPDIILLDVMMPGMSGYEVCRAIKSHHTRRDIPIIMVTALTEVEDVQKAVDAGTDDFLSKPVNRLEIVTRVKSLLKLRHLRRELERTMSALEQMEKGQADGRT
jgi:two-component system, OmpR family, alkaline phosphatase synthesis response regulator PhoP